MDEKLNNLIGEKTENILDVKKKVNFILLTQQQVDAIMKTIHEDNSLIITQSLWKKLNSTLNMSKTAYCRRATASGFKVKIGYGWHEYKKNCSTKAIVQIRCIHCSKVHLYLARKLFARYHRVQACPKCYSTIYQYDQEWRRKNSVAQLVAQNRPETIKKHRENSRLLWVGDHGKIMREAQIRTVSTPEYKANMSRIMSNKWSSDPDYRDRVCGKGSYKHSGNYENNTIYHSKLELAFLLWCDENTKHVIRCDFFVTYISLKDGLEHKYYPDFIVDKNTIVEVKGQRWIDVDPLVYRSKIDSLSKWCNANGYSYRVVLDKDLKNYSKKATKYHETQKQVNNSV
jgi:phage FluMu protein Com